MCGLMKIVTLVYEGCLHVATWDNDTILSVRRFKDFSGMLVENGLARVYREYDYSRKSVYLAMEENAQLSKVGLWGRRTSHSGGEDD